jgi:putative hemolysin
MSTPYVKPKWNLSIEADDFIVKIAESSEDIVKAQKLRHKIFLEEGLGQTHESGLDFDAYDSIADHLMIIDRKSGDAVGTYRLIHSSEAPRFYSQTEFYLDEFLQIDGAKLEMGRACTHMDFRNGRTMDLLWQGFSQYISLSKTRYLFGCSSVKTTDGLYMFSMMKSLAENEQLKWDFNIYPIPGFQWPNAQAIFDTASPMKGYTKELPPLLRSYLNAGSFVYGLPAYDKDFLCFDLLTILDLQKLNKKFQARYNLEGFLQTIH